MSIPFSFQSPLSSPTRPVKVVHFSNAVADATNDVLDASMSFFMTDEIREANDELKASTSLFSSGLMLTLVKAELTFLTQSVSTF
nr:hypothetical protein Iba_chr13eCG12810 [Ipomoea batatas]